MGQMLSREDEEDELQQHELRENAEPRVEEPVERPRQRKRDAAGKEPGDNGVANPSLPARRHTSNPKHMNTTAKTT